MTSPITVSAVINAPRAKVWQYWNEPEHIKNWCFASDDWCVPHAENDVREGGTFVARMEAKDKSAGFDFGGTYTQVEDQKFIAYTMDDGRKVSIAFEEGEDGTTTVTETFDAETENSLEMQRAGWQAILDNFKGYVENK